MERQGAPLGDLGVVHNCGDWGAEVQRILHKPEGWANKAHKGQPQQLCSCLTLQPFVGSAGI